jgi:hypothetical protein
MSFKITGPGEYREVQGGRAIIAKWDEGEGCWRGRDSEGDRACYSEEGGYASEPNTGHPFDLMACWDEPTGEAGAGKDARRSEVLGQVMNREDALIAEHAAIRERIRLSNRLYAKGMTEAAFEVLKD